jgi:diguanylate cyclase (GGDEF)-like protein
VAGFSKLSAPESGRAWLRAVVLPAAMTLLLLAAIVGAILEFSTRRTDELALVRQNQRVTVAVAQSLESITVDQEASSYWDDAVLRTRERPLDLIWIDNNLGVWFHTYYKFDEVYLLDQRNAPIYAMQNGRRAPPASFKRVAGPALELAADLRRKLSVARLAPDGSPGKTVGASEISIIGGRPAFVSLKPVVSETGKVSQPKGSEYLHVTVRFLDRSFLDDLSKLYVVDEPRFARTNPGPASVAVRDRDGKVLGYFAWTPFKPGAQVEEHMVPVLLAALLGTGLLVSLLLWRIWRSRSDLEQSRADAEHLAFHDSLTGLPNRALFENRLELALSRRGAHVAVLLLDLDRFKNVNDTLGHQAGDSLISGIGSRLSSLTRECDTISRIGGDEFAILIEDARLTDVHRLARRIVEDIRKPFKILGSQVYVGVSIGIALSPESGADRPELMRTADISLYRAKDRGRNGYCVFTPEMDESVKLRVEIEKELHNALDSGEGLRVHYQPQVGANGAIIGLEALVRWDHPTRGLIEPAQFVSVAEETGLIVPLGEWVLRKACLMSRRWPRLFVAVNLSPVQFRSPDLFNSFIRIVRETEADPRAIQLEVTERVLLDDDDDNNNQVGAMLARLREAGFKIVLDDFGTGYSSLSYLTRFPFDTIKIDKSFVDDSTPKRTVLLKSMINMVHELGLSVVAEGVSDENDALQLRQMGCEYVQSFMFGAPVSGDQALRMLREQYPVRQA